MPLLVAVLIPLMATVPRAAALPFAAGGVVLLIALWLWQARCCPSTGCQRLLRLLFGLTTGTAFAGLATAMGLPQAVPVLVVGAIFTGITAAVAVIRRCLGLCDDGC